MAPAETMTLLPEMASRLLACSAQSDAPVDRDVIATSAVSPITTPMPWSMKTPLPVVAPG